MLNLSLYFKSKYSSLFLKFAALCTVVLPAFLLAYFILENGVNVPFWDDWHTPATGLILTSEGQLSFSHLISQHNESRKFFPRLLFIGLAYLTGWDIRYQLLITFLLACLISFCLYRISRITIQGSEYKRLALLLLANLLIFSPAQYHNWLWGIQVVVFIPAACIIGGILVSYSNLKVQFKTLILILICTVSTFSYANGMLSWFILFPGTLLLTRLASKREPQAQRWLLFGGTFACVANLTLYFYHYVKPISHPSLSEPLLHPFEAIRFFFAFLGAPLASGQLTLAINLGAVITFLFSFACLYILSHRKDRLLLNQAIAWLMIGTYSFVSGLITTAGRLGFGLGSAIPSRYTTFSSILIVVLIYLLIIIFDHAVQRHYLSGKILIYLVLIIFDHTVQHYYLSGKKRLVALSILLCLLVSLVFFGLMAYKSGVENMVRIHRERFYAKASLLFINVVEDRATIEAALYPNYDFVKSQANKLNKFHFLKPGLVESSNLLALANKQQKPIKTYGYLNEIVQIGNGEFTVLGWATLPERNKAADAVILAYETPRGEIKAFAIAAVGDESFDLAQILHNPAYHHVRWRKTFPRDKLPKGSIKISAWAMDTETGQVFRLVNADNLPRL